MIVEKDSSVLGYPGEISKSLNADHHNVCKYSGPTDPNYIVVRDVLAGLISKAVATGRQTIPTCLSRNKLQDLKSLLGITYLPDIDYIFFHDQWTPGTNEWVFEDQEFTNWLHAQEPAQSILWMNGGPATGKSVLSSSIINSLMERHFCCQYFFLRFDDKKKRTLSLMLRSIAYQIAQCVPEFLQGILHATEEATDFESADPNTIWERIFRSVLPNMSHAQPLYWIIDGLDEADNPRAIIQLLSNIHRSAARIKVLFVSRRTSEIVTAFQKLPEALNSRVVSMEGHIEDFHRYIGDELSMPGGADFKELVAQRVINGAQNNFLVSNVRI